MKGTLYFGVMFLLMLVVGKAMSFALHWIYDAKVIVPISMALILAWAAWKRTN